MTPYWPISYDGHTGSGECLWEISMPRGKRIKFNFMMVNTYTPNPGEMLCNVNENDVLIVKGMVYLLLISSVCGTRKC